MNLHTINTISFSLKTIACRKAFLLILFVFTGLLSVNGQDGYFQQYVSYDIKVSLDDTNHYLTGTISISYKNNSPDTLPFIWMHLWPNAYSDRSTALSQQLLEEGRKGLYFAKKEDLGFIDQIAFSTNGKPLLFKLDPENKDIGKLQLADPLLPGEIIEFSTPFRVKIPSGKFSRMGHIGESYQISQWFPKPAVYDRDGWHEMPYLDQGEFYSEFGTFRVEITLPENYVVASTGRLQEASEKDWLLEKAKATAALTNFDTTLSFPASSKTLKTLTFIQDSIHDFAWFADKRFHVLKSEFILPESGRPVECWAYFTNKESKLWKNSLEYIENGLRYYSERVGAYPYSSYSAVDGTITAGGGMEYPMITVIGGAGSAAGLEEVIVHELGHSWFYGILGSNERENGWMDEGLNSYYEMKYLDGNNKGIPLPDKENGKAGFKIKIPGFDDKISAKDGFRFAVAYTSFDNSDQPVKTPSQQFTYTNYGAVMYSKTALAFDFLEDYLGTPAFDKAMHDYYGIWKFRHPGPADIESAFENSAQKDLDWFFNGLLSTSVPVNYTIKKSNSGNGSLQLDITNKGIVAAPLKIQEGTETPVWTEGFSGSKSITLTDYNDSTIFLNKGYSQLLKTNGSVYRNRALLPGAKDYRIRLFPQLVPKENSETFVLLPMVAWNRYNEGMAGIVFSNFSLFPDNFEFTLAPLYDFKNSDLAGIGSLKYHIWPVQGIFKEITTSVHGKRFAYTENTYGPENTVDADEPVYNYSKFSPEILVKFRKKNPRATLQHMLSYRNISLWLDEEYSDSITTHKNITSYLNYNELAYGFSDNRTLDPYSGLIRAEQGKNYSKISGEFKYRFSYAKFNKGVDIRFFAGGFIDNGNSNTRNYNFRMSGWEGSQDYLYDELFFGRTDDHGFWKQQFLVRDGGFKTPTIVGQSNKWIAALNLDIDLPVPIPIGIFAGLGTYDGIKTVFEDLNNVFMYEGGIAIRPIRDILEIYVPLFYSDDINQTLDLNNIDFVEQIRFVFNINKITPYALRNRFLEER